MKRGGHADGVDGKSLHHDIQIFPYGAIHADADSGIGNHHVGHALRGDTGLPRGHDAVCLLYTSPSPRD